jgi:lysozyme family protein
MNFEAAFAVVIGHEGGYVDDQRDPGGETKYGISKRAYPAEDIKALTLDRAKQIYQRDYWDRCSCSSLPAWLRLMVFDTAVNMGTDAAAKILQMSLGVAVDGQIGPKTLGAAGRADISVLDEYGARRALKYAGLKTFATFGLGWFRRLFVTHRLSQE